MPHIRSRTSKSTKENDERKGGKGEKDTQDGKGKDHQLSQPSRQTTLQPKSRDLVMACNSGQDDHMGGGAPQWPLSQTQWFVTCCANGQAPRRATALEAFSASHIPPSWCCLCAR